MWSILTIQNGSGKQTTSSLQFPGEDAMKRRFLWAFLLLMLVSGIASRAATLPFIQDDFAKARAQAMQRKLPIFVECWAPW
jgi:hypothetical protein